MAGITDAQNRWQVIRSKGRNRGIVALIGVLVVVVAIGLLGGSNATLVAVIVIVALFVVAALVAIIGKQRTGLSLTPEWKPETVDEEYDDFDDDDDDYVAGADERASEADHEDDIDVPEDEPVRRLDAQILGADLAKLGQVVTPKLAKSYAVGTLVLEGSVVVWEPGTTSRAAGIEALTAEPDQVTAIEAAPLWGSWGLVRVATAGGDEWCLRVPGSVDLSPAFAELGLTVRQAA